MIKEMCIHLTKDQDDEKSFSTLLIRQLSWGRFCDRSVKTLELRSAKYQSSALSRPLLFGSVPFIFFFF